MTDTALGQIEVPTFNLNALCGMINRPKASTTVKAKQLASVTCTLIKLILWVLPLVLLAYLWLVVIMWCLTQGSYGVVPLKLPRNSYTSVILFFNFNKINSQPFWYSPSTFRVVCSDARDTGYIGYAVEHGEHILNGQRSAENCSQT